MVSVGGRVEGWGRFRKRCKKAGKQFFADTLQCMSCIDLQHVQPKGDQYTLCTTIFLGPACHRVS